MKYRYESQSYLTSSFDHDHPNIPKVLPTSTSKESTITSTFPSTVSPILSTPTFQESTITFTSPSTVPTLLTYHYRPRPTSNPNNSRHTPDLAYTIDLSRSNQLIALCKGI